MKNLFTSTLSSIALGLLLAAVAWLSYISAVHEYRKNIPVSSIFTAAVQVPNFPAGENPHVIYNRVIYQDFIGSFSVEVKRIKDSATLCIGSISGLKYSVDESFDEELATLDWYIGKKCSANLKPGNYFLETTYTINVSEVDYPRKYLTTTSNIFSVIDPALEENLKQKLLSSPVPVQDWNWED